MINSLCVHDVHYRRSRTVGCMRMAYPPSRGNETLERIFTPRLVKWVLGTTWTNICGGTVAITWRFRVPKLRGIEPLGCDQTAMICVMSPFCPVLTDPGGVPGNQNDSTRNKESVLGE